MADKKQEPLSDKFITAVVYLAAGIDYLVTQGPTDAKNAFRKALSLPVLQTEEKTSLFTRIMGPQ
jgi:hypothetical protein